MKYETLSSLVTTRFHVLGQVVTSADSATDTVNKVTPGLVAETSKVIDCQLEALPVAMRLWPSPLSVLAFVLGGIKLVEQHMRIISRATLWSDRAAWVNIRAGIRLHIHAQYAREANGPFPDKSIRGGMNRG
jgi:hypothetical protein